MGTTKKWEDHEIAYLRDHCQEMTCREIAKELSRTVRSVQHKFGQLGLVRKSTKPNQAKLGQKFSRLTVTKEPWSVPVGKAGKVKWRVGCTCDCGTNTECWLNSILESRTVSCGCYKRESASKRATKRNKKYSDDIIKHKLYRVWGKIKQAHGEEALVKEWRTNYEAFYNHCLPLWKDGLCCTRPDHGEPYGPDNVHFVPQHKLSLFGSPKGEQEQQLKDWLNSHGFAFKSNWSILGGKEIDLYSEHLGLGIEYCGLLWHTEKYGRSRNYHRDKMVECNRRGVDLITVFADEWMFRTDQVKSVLKAKLGLNKRIYARNCKVEVVDGDTAKDLVNRWHIQTIRQAPKLAIGLKYQDEFIAIITFAPHHRKGNGVLTLNRMCFLDGMTVVGGASRMFKHACSHIKGMGYTTVVSWSDNRWSQGNVYSQLGFDLEAALPPEYAYVHLTNSKIRVPKQSMQKSKIGCPAEITEKVYCESLGYSRIWDCGKKRWVYAL